MDVLKFTLKGNTAFFKMPEVNTHYYFTYGNIHKVALLGLFGAVLGYKGYGQMKKEDDFPEFYERLKELQIAIVPDKDAKGYIPKKIQRFNNSVGYASQETGGNLIVKEQWLENPKWDIYVKIDNQEAERLKEMMLTYQVVYIPYLGSNDHLADITDVDIYKAIEVKEEELDGIDSLFPGNLVELDMEEDEIVPYKYEEYLPVALKKKTHMYQLEKMIYTNIPVISHQSTVYEVEEKFIVFF